MFCSVFCFFLFFPLWLRWRLYVYEGNFNHFEHKLCQTKPNSETPKMNITNYMTSSYSNNLQFRPMQKQSQTNPKFTCYKGCKVKTKPKQTQFYLAEAPVLRCAGEDGLAKSIAVRGQG